MDVKAMSTIRVEADRIVDARPRDVYAFLADYTDKRPTILPPAYEGYTVEKGGRGAGTVVRYVLNAGRSGNHPSAACSPKRTPAPRS
jgi:hypothetical protein